MFKLLIIKPEKKITIKDRGKRTQYRGIRERIIAYVLSETCKEEFDEVIY